MLFTSVGDDIDIDILSALWPNNWNAAQLLLKEEGFSDAKEYCICICRETKEMEKQAQNISTIVCGASWKAKMSYALIVVRRDTQSITTLV